MSKSKILGCSYAVLGAALVLPLAAVAQESTEAVEAVEQQAQVEESRSLDVVIVTAQKRSESINEVPLSINVASGEALEAQGIHDVQGLVKVVPGFNAIDSGYGTPVYFLRGIGFFDSTLAAKPTVGIYIDEVPIAYSIMSKGASFDLERVEVVKGPQGTLFGSNATGGAINYIAAKPTDEFDAGFSVDYGRFNRFFVEGHASGPISDTLSGRVALRIEGGDDWQESYTRSDSLGARDFAQGRVILAWEPTDNLDVDFMFNFNQDNSDTQAAQLVEPFQQSSGFFDPRLVAYEPAPEDNRAADWGSDFFPLERDNEMQQSSLRIDYDILDSLTLTSITSYAEFEEAYGQDSDSTALRLTDLYITGNIEAFTQEFRLAGDIWNGGNWILGANYETSSTSELVSQFLADQSSAHAFDALGLPSITEVPQQSEIDYDSWGIFANVSIPLTSTLTASGGVRYTETDIDFSACNLNGGNGSYGRGLEILFGMPEGTIPIGACATLDPNNVPTRFNGTLPEDNVSWRASLEWQPADYQLIYATVSRGYKAGSFATLPGSQVDQYNPVNQEEVTAYELGFKSGLLNQLLQLNGAVFYYDYTDKQLKGRTIVPIFGPLEALVNIPKSRVQGAELQAIASPMEGLNLNVGVTYLDTEVTDTFSNYTAFGALADFEGSAFPYTPQLQFNSDVEYTWSASSTLDAFVGGSYTYRSETSGDFIEDERLDIDAYGLLDLRAGIASADGNWRLSVYGQNVTDEYYWHTAARRGDAVIRFTGMPTTYGVNLRVNF